MSSRKKPKPTPATPPPQDLQFKPPTVRLWMIVICLGVLAGILAGVIAYFLYPTGISVGTFNTTMPTPAPAVSDQQLFASYAGSAACRECHAKEYELWSSSHHGLAERAPDPAIDAAAFDPPRTFEHGSQKTQVRVNNGKYEIITPGYEAAPTAYPVSRVIGVDPLRQFLTAVPGGRLQTLEASYDPHKNQWFNVYGNEDRHFGEWGHWTGRGMNWNSMCASCHNTRVRKNYDEKSDSYQTTMAQFTVSCESCHGPMKSHADRQKSYAGTAHPAASQPSASYKFSKDQILDTCATCHARRADLTGDFVPGDAFHDHHSLTIPDLSELFYPDGQVREEDYEFTAFLGSKMHAAGVRCADCHDPHSSKPLFAGNALCMRCHNGSFKGSPIIVPEQHSFHKPDSAGNQCVNCHMPQTTYMQRHGRHDHGFTIPDPLLTKEQKIPNACNRCHADKDADWSLAATDKWYGAKMERPTRERARWIAKARRGDDTARAAILRQLKEEKQPFWQAVAAGVLGQWIGSSEVPPALVAALDHADVLVRENAARSLEPLAQQRDPAVRQALERRLNDPARSVRVRAAWALRDAINLESPAGRDLLTYLNQSADQPGGAMQQGIYHIARNEVEPAVGYFTKAVNWDPNSAPFRDSLAVALSMQGKTGEAIGQLEWAAKLDPRDAEYPYKLALAYSESGELGKTIDLLQRTLNLNPRHPRAAYNLGLAFSQANQPDQAIAALKRAEATSPNDAQIPYARATIHARLGQKADARDAARRALQLDPAYTDAARLLQSLGP